MQDLNSIVPHEVPNEDRDPHEEPQRRASQDPKQRKLMLGSLCLLLVALGIVIWRHSDFWSRYTQGRESDEPAEIAPGTKIAPVEPPAAAAKPLTKTKPKPK